MDKWLFLCNILTHCFLAKSDTLAYENISPSRKLDAKLALFIPKLEQLAKNMAEILSKNFQYVKVTVEQCPDLTQSPFFLISKGLGGSMKIVDIGGNGNLFPIIQQDKKYDLKQICETIDSENCIILGPGAGPKQNLGFNSEAVHNARILKDSDQLYNSFVIYLKNQTSEPSVKIERLSDNRASGFILMANLVVTDGLPGPVLKVEAKNRTGSKNLITQMRKGLKEKYGNETVALGGVFVVNNGTTKLHVMPELPATPFKNREAIGEWLYYYNAQAPLTCASLFVTHDPGLDLRMEHSHCFSNHGQGGHYHYDSSGENVHYTGFFAPAHFLYRIDRVPQ